MLVGSIVAVVPQDGEGWNFFTRRYWALEAGVFVAILGKL
jgi:hypothetical protein